MSEILLAGGGVAIVDEDCYTALSQITWSISASGYAVHRYRNRVGNQTIRMHREVYRLKGIGIPEGMELDHINHNRLDNRCENLRLCNRGLNLANKPYKSKYGLRGIDKQNSGKFLGRVQLHGKIHYTRTFDTPEEAARARDELAKQIHGEFATLNYP